MENYNIIGTDSHGDWLLLTASESNLNLWMEIIKNDKKYTDRFHQIQAVRCSH